MRCRFIRLFPCSITKYTTTDAQMRITHVGIWVKLYYYYNTNPILLWYSAFGSIRVISVDR